MFDKCENRYVKNWFYGNAGDTFVTINHFQENDANRLLIKFSQSDKRPSSFLKLRKGV